MSDVAAAARSRHGRRRGSRGGGGRGRRHARDAPDSRTAAPVPRQAHACRRCCRRRPRPGSARRSGTGRTAASTRWRTLGLEYPRDPVVQLYRGIALLWAGYGSDAVAPLEKAKKLGRDTPWEVAADNLLHPSTSPTTRRSGRSAAPEPAARAAGRGSRPRGTGTPPSSSSSGPRDSDPNDDQAQVAAAVGRFDKGDLSASFSRLGPLTRRFPRSQSVRYYLGLLLAWTGQRDPALTAVPQDGRARPGHAAREGRAGVRHRDPEGWDQAVGRMSRTAHASVRRGCNSSASARRPTSGAPREGCR